MTFTLLCTFLRWSEFTTFRSVRFNSITIYQNVQREINDIDNFAELQKEQTEWNCLKLPIKHQTRSWRKYYRWKSLKENSLFNLIKKLDTNLRLENVDAIQSVSLDENPRLHLTKFQDGMAEWILFFIESHNRWRFTSSIVEVKKRISELLVRTDAVWTTTLIPDRF